MDKIVFLDFDGVLNTEHYQGMLQSQGKSWKDEHGPLFDPSSVEQLKRIIEETGADIVVESFWKYIGLDAMKKLWEDRALPGMIIDVTPLSVVDDYVKEYLNDINGSKFHCKGMEIASWLSEHGNSATRYVIIDDEYVVLDSQLSNFILTNPFEGITKEQADKAISILCG